MHISSQYGLLSDFLSLWKDPIFCRISLSDITSSDSYNCQSYVLQLGNDNRNPLHEITDLIAS